MLYSESVNRTACGNSLSYLFNKRLMNSCRHQACFPTPGAQRRRDHTPCFCAPLGGQIMEPVEEAGSSEE